MRVRRHAWMLVGFGAIAGCADARAPQVGDDPHCVIGKCDDPSTARKLIYDFGDDSSSPRASGGYTIAMSGNGRVVYVEGAGERIDLWKHNGERFDHVGMVRDVRDHGLPVALATSHDGRVLAIGDPLDAGEVEIRQLDESGMLVGEAVRLENEREDVVGYGRSVAMSADGATLAITSVWARADVPDDTPNVDVYERSATGWTRTQQLSVPVLTTGEINAMRVAAPIATLAGDGETLVVARRANDCAATDATRPFCRPGDAHVFVRDMSGAFVPSGILSAPESMATTDAEIGRAVALSTDGQVIAIGAPGFALEPEAATGAVFVYRREGDAFIQAATFRPSRRHPFARFGASVDLDLAGHTVVVGSPGQRTGGQLVATGAAYVFTASGQGWREQQLVSPIAVPQDQEMFGELVVVADDTSSVWIASFQHSNLGHGARRVFTPGLDRDDDTIRDERDNCPRRSNTDQANHDEDADGDACDKDDDGDLRLDGEDNCNLVPNPGQQDADRDGRGDACDGDNDGDGLEDDRDNCPRAENADQANLDGDPLGDVCDLDDDQDDIEDVLDNCPRISNPDRVDTDGDRDGDACDADDDNDGVIDATDNCAFTANVDQADADNDGAGDPCDDDRDGDNVRADDNCPTHRNPDQRDLDRDAIGDACDPDDDNDGVTDARDNCRQKPNPDQIDIDRDGSGDECDLEVIPPQDEVDEEPGEGEEDPDLGPGQPVGCSSSRGAGSSTTALGLALAALSRRRRRLA